MTKTSETSADPLSPAEAREQTPEHPATEDRASSSAPAPLLPAGSEDDAIHRALDAADDRQIAADIQGRAPSAVLYSFRQGGQQVTDLAWKGVHEAIRILNSRGHAKIGVVEGTAQFERTTIPVEGEEEPAPAITVRVYAKDELRGGGYYGTATQPLQQRTRKGLRPDPFAEAKALSKAQRNALRPFIPLEAVEELRALYTGAGQVEYVTGTATELPELPPALTDEKALGLGEEIRALYDAFKKHEGALRELPPAEFHRYFTASQHSHERLEEFRDFMCQKLEEAEGE